MTKEDPQGEMLAFSKLPFSQIISEMNKRFNGNLTPLTEYEVEGDIEPASLYTTLSLPYEISFTEHNGHTIVTMYDDTNIRYDVWEQWDAYQERMKSSTLNGHTHNNRKDGTVMPVLSLQDILSFRLVSNGTRIALIHSNGVSVFQKPVFDLGAKPLNSDGMPATEEQYSRLLDEYQAQKGINFHAHMWGKQVISRPRQDQLAKEFVTRTGMLVETAAWNSRRIHRMMDIINCREPQAYQTSIAERVRGVLSEGIRVATRRWHAVH